MKTDINNHFFRKITLNIFIAAVTMFIALTLAFGYSSIKSIDIQKCEITDASFVKTAYHIYQNGDMSIEEALNDVISSYNGGYLPASEIEKALNQGAFPGYRNYFISQGIPLSGGSSAAPVTTTETASQSSDTSNDTSSTASKAAKEEKKEPTQEEIDAAWEETDRIEPGCVDEGKITYTNSITGDTKEETIPALGHDYVETERIEPTCTEDGSVTYTCTRDDDTYTETLEALGHTPAEPKITEVAATWFNDGYKTTEVYCEVCGDLLSSETEIYPAIIPVWVRIAVPAGVAVVVAAVIILLVRKRKKQG